MDAEIWNKRYLSKEFIYGKEPNLFYRNILDGLVPGKILFPGEGEGRNAVYAARQGWTVDAFDQSVSGKNKAEELAAVYNTKIKYSVAGVESFIYPAEDYDAITIIFLHLPEKLRYNFFTACIQALKPGGRLILEVFHLDQINRDSGGPKDLKLLYSLEDIRSGFSGLKTLLLEKNTVALKEGMLHRGDAEVIQFLGTKA